MIARLLAAASPTWIMRAAANELQPRLKQTLVIENQGGAAGNPRSELRRRGRDGYTICVIYHSTMSYNPAPVHQVFLTILIPTSVPIARLFFLMEGLFVSQALGVNSARRTEGESAVVPPTSTTQRWASGLFHDLSLRWLNNEC